MNRLSTTLVALVVLVAAAPATAVADDTASPLHLGGDLLFEDRCEEAEARFDSLARGGATDPAALYGRGLARMCRDDLDGAIADLSLVAERRPDDPRVALDLGSALTSAGKYEDAEPWLRKAVAASKLEGAATLLLGVGQLNRGDLDAARRSFAEVRRIAPRLDDQARYYDGVAASRAGELAAAEDELRAVAARRPRTTLGTDAARRADAVSAERDALFRVRGRVGFEYDSNVALAPNDEVLRDEDLDDLEDGRFTLGADLRWLGLHSGTLVVESGYSFFQSFHFDQDDFDLQAHRPEIAVRKEIGSFTLGLGARYDFFLRSRSFDLFEHQWSLRPSISLREGELGETELSYRYRGRKFTDDDFEDLDGDNHSVGIEQTVRLGGASRQLRFGYAFDTELLDDQYRVPTSDPNLPPPAAESVANEYEYDGHEVHLGGMMTFPLQIGAAVRYAFRFEDYGSGSSFFDEDGDEDDREDQRHAASLSFGRPLWEGVRVDAGYYGDFNRSNNDSFTYDRHVGFVTISAEF